MRDQQHGGAGAFAQFGNQVKDLRLHGHVQRSGGLIGNQHIGFAGQSHGDHDALAHTTGKLVWVFMHPTLGGRDAHRLQHLYGPRQCSFAVQPLMQAHGFADLITHGVGGVERGHGLLEDHRDAVAPVLAHLGLAELQQVAPVQRHAP